MKPKYPHVKVQLVGNDGNAFSIIARVRREMRRAKISSDEIDAFIKEATSGDYDHLLATCTKYVEVQ